MQVPVIHWPSLFTSFFSSDVSRRSLVAILWYKQEKVRQLKHIHAQDTHMAASDYMYPADNCFTHFFIFSSWERACFFNIWKLHNWVWSVLVFAILCHAMYKCKLLGKLEVIWRGYVHVYTSYTSSDDILFLPDSPPWAWGVCPLAESAPSAPPPASREDHGRQPPLQQVSYVQIM